MNMQEVMPQGLIVCTIHKCTAGLFLLWHSSVYEAAAPHLASLHGKARHVLQGAVAHEGVQLDAVELGHTRTPGRRHQTAQRAQRDGCHAAKHGRLACHVRPCNQAHFCAVMHDDSCLESLFTRLINANIQAKAIQALVKLPVHVCEQR